MKTSSIEGRFRLIIHFYEKGKFEILDLDTWVADQFRFNIQKPSGISSPDYFQELVKEDSDSYLVKSLNEADIKYFGEESKYFEIIGTYKVSFYYDAYNGEYDNDSEVDNVKFQEIPEDLINENFFPEKYYPQKTIEFFSGDDPIFGKDGPKCSHKMHPSLCSMHRLHEGWAEAGYDFNEETKNYEKRKT